MGCFLTNSINLASINIFKQKASYTQEKTKICEKQLLKKITNKQPCLIVKIFEMTNYLTLNTLLEKCKQTNSYNERTFLTD